MTALKISDKKINLLISLFIIWNIAAVPFSSSYSYSQQNPIQRFFAPYLKWTRLNQRWPLFTPTPRKLAHKYRVDIIYQDNQKIEWRRPYPPKWGFFERHLAYNFQKWDLASDYLKREHGLWRDLSKFVINLHEVPNNPIKYVQLYLETAPWPPPKESGNIWVDDKELQWKEQKIFTYNVKEDWLNAEVINE